MSAARNFAWAQLALLTLLTLLTLGLAGAATAATVCTVSALPVAFGVYSPTAASAHTSTGSVSVVCQPVLASAIQTYTLTLSTGGSGSYAMRRLSASGHTLNYQLYKDAAYAAVWGDGSSGTSSLSGTLSLSVVLPVSATHTVYGRMPALQSGAYAGSYLDTITVTVTY